MSSDEVAQALRRSPLFEVSGVSVKPLVKWYSHPNPRRDAPAEGPPPSDPSVAAPGPTFRSNAVRAVLGCCHKEPVLASRNLRGYVRMATVMEHLDRGGLGNADADAVLGALKRSPLFAVDGLWVKALSQQISQFQCKILRGVLGCLSLPEVQGLAAGPEGFVEMEVVRQKHPLVTDAAELTRPLRLSPHFEVTDDDAWVRTRDLKPDETGAAVWEVPNEDIASDATCARQAFLRVAMQHSGPALESRFAKILRKMDEDGHQDCLLLELLRGVDWRREHDVLLCRLLSLEEFKDGFTVSAQVPPTDSAPQSQSAS